MSALCQILGGIDTIDDSVTVIQTVGGFDRFLKPHTQNKVVGDTGKTFLKNKITEWKTFQDVYYKNGKLSPKYYDNLITAMNNIFPLPVITEEDKDLVYMITTMYNSTNDQFCNGIYNILNLLDPYKQTIRGLFMEWKVYLEKLIEIFVELRADYIIHNKLDSQNSENDFAKLVEKWIAIDMENKVETSSPILFFNFPPKTSNLEKSIPKIEWRIKGADPHITKLIDIFLDSVKTSEFEYCGFCIHDVIKRFIILMKFPYSNILDIIKSLDIKLKYDKINNQSDIIINKIAHIKKQILSIKNYKNINIVKKSMPKKFPKTPEDKIAFYEKYIEAYLTIYKQIMPSFIKKEKLICELSLNINSLANDVNKLTGTFDEMIFKK